jgi:tripartite-type tricarboxylate transporter receptor subunit TctC
MNPSNLTRRTVVVALGCAMAAASSSAWSADAEYPTHRITMVVPFTPGGTADILARIVASGLKDALGQPVIVENRAGADGNIGAADVAAAAADGYTLLVGPTSTNAINPSLHKGLTFDARRDFVAIANLGTVPNVLVVPPTIKARSVRELIAAAKAGQLSFASGGVGGSQHLSGALFEHMAGVQMLHVPYKGGNAQMNDLLSGRVDLMFCNLPVCLPQIRAGKLVALGVTSAQRSALLPDVPTIAEAGVPDYNVEGWFGLFAPTGTPKAVVDRLNAEVVKLMNAPKTRELLLAQGAEPGRASADQFGAFVRQEQVRWAQVIRDAKISVE